MKIFASLNEDAHQGWVWLHDPALPPRSVVKIKNYQSGEVIYCEALQIDDNFLTQYNQHPRHSITSPSNSIVVGAWYRAKLGGIKTQSDIHVKVSACNSWYGQFRACIDHPQIVVRLASWLGGIGLALGLIGLVLGIFSIWPKA